MTNQRKSYIVSIFVILALAFGVILISQSLMARVDPKLERMIVDDNGVLLTVPLPSDDISLQKTGRTPSTPGLPAIKGTSPDATDPRTTDEAATSAENGGDTYATATVIAALPYVDAGTTVGATSDYSASCGSDGAGDVVYAYTATFTGSLLASTCNSGSPSNIDSKLWVVKAIDSSSVACNDDDAYNGGCMIGNGYASTLIADVVAGETYYIVVGAYGAGSETAFQLRVARINGAVGQSGFQPLTITFPAANSSATYAIDLSAPTVQGCSAFTTNVNSRSLFFSFLAPKNGMYTFSWCDDGVVPIGASSYTTIAMPVGRGNGTYYSGYYYDYAAYYAGYGCQDAGAFELIDYPIAEGIRAPFFEILTRLGEGLQGTLTVTWTDLPMVNDDCADAIDLGIGTTATTFGHNLGATLDGPAIDLCSPADPSEVCADVWYVWQADVDGYARFDMCAGGTDNKMWVYAGDQCLSTNPREAANGGCSDDGCGVGGGAPFGEIACHAGDRFLIRVAGWYIAGDATYGNCAQYGMGVFYIQCEVFPTSIRPVNDNCTALVPTVLTNGTLLQIPGQTNKWAGWDCLPTLNNVVMECNTWHAITVPFCADTLEVNFCGTLDGTRSTFNPPYNLAPIMTGCPCSGDYVTIYANNAILATAWCTAEGFDATHDGNATWLYRTLIPGDYYFPVARSAARMGVYVFDYQINFKATSGACVYCAATANLSACPPVAGATYIDRVSLANMVNPPLPTGSGCHAYQDFTAVTAKVYKGFPYTLTVRYGRQGGGALGATDSCDVWIDWNQNSGLAANQTETSERTRLVRVGQDVVCSFTVPLTAYKPLEGATGSTLMRVRLANTNDGSNAACGTKVWGEVEDYTLIVADLECGDFNVDGTLDAADIAFLRNYYFGSGAAPDIWQRGDIDGDGAITIADIIALSDAAYRSGPLNCL